MRTPLPVIAFRALGVGTAILLMQVLAQTAEVSYAQVPFVTSIVLAIGLPDTPASTPRAILGGHVLSTLSGIVVLFLFGTGDLPAALAVGLATIVMAATRSMHPPAGLDAFLVVSQSLPAFWLVVPVLPGAILLAIFALVWRRLGDRLFRPPAGTASVPSEPESDLANFRRPHLRPPD